MRKWENQDILYFIDKFKSRNPEVLTDLFDNGYCYYFAEILKTRFGGEIFFNPNLVHFSVLINNNFYDINGLIESKDNWYLWEDFQYSNLGSAIKKSCIFKL